MSFIMNSEGNKEFKENSGDSQRGKPFSLPEMPWRRRIADQTLGGSQEAAGPRDAWEKAGKLWSPGQSQSDFY